MIFIMFPCLGASKLACSSPKKYVDLSFDKLKELGYSAYMNRVYDSAVSRSVFVVADKDVVASIKSCGLPYMVVFPDISLESEWIERARIASCESSFLKDYDAYCRVKDNFQKYYELCVSCGLDHMCKIDNLKYDLKGIVSGVLKGVKYGLE